jgi:IS30 family transposase
VPGRGRGKIAADVVLRQFVAGRLEKRWSPERICQALRREFPDDAARHVVHETIYQAVYRPGLGGLPRGLPARALRTRRRRRRPHRRADQRRPDGITAMTMPDQRPAEAADRAEPGHWEEDLITGSATGRRSARWWTGHRGSPSCCICPDGTPPGRSATR